MQNPKRGDDNDRQRDRFRPNRSGKGAGSNVNSANPSDNDNRNSAKKDDREQRKGNFNYANQRKSQQSTTPKMQTKTADNYSGGGHVSHRSGINPVADLFRTPNSARPAYGRQSSQPQQPSSSDASTPRGGMKNVPRHDSESKTDPKKTQSAGGKDTKKNSPATNRSAKGSAGKGEDPRGFKKRSKVFSQISPEMQAKLKENLINITEKHDKIGFHCDPCSCNFASLEEAINHMDSFWLHLYKKQLRKTSPPKGTLSKEHADALTQLLDTIYLENAATQGDYDRWCEIASELQSRLTDVLETVRAEPAGLQGCHLAMKSNVLNVCLSSADGKSATSARLLASLFQNSELAARCGLNFESSNGEENLRLTRRATFTYSNEKDPVPITLSVMCLDPETKALLDLYQHHQAEILPRLAVAFQFWAKCVGFFDHNVLIPEALAVMTVHFLQHCPQPLLPILPPGEVKMHPVSFKSSNQNPLGQMWVSMLYYYSFTFQYDKFAIDVVSLRGSLALRDPEAKHSNRRRLFVNTAHPDAPQRFNLARLLKPDLMFDFFHDRVMWAFKYFSTPPENRASLLLKASNSSAISNLTESLEKLNVTPPQDLCREVWVSQLVNGVVASSIDNVVSRSSDHGEPCQELASKIVNGVISEAILTLAREPTEFDDLLNEKNFTFSRSVFLSNPKVDFPIACNYCGTTDHPSTSCKRVLWTKPEPLPPMTEPFLKQLDHAIVTVVDDMSDWPNWGASVDCVVNDVMNAIKGEFGNAQLHLYGSCKNGFQVWPSDVDLCLTFNGKDSVPAEQVDKILVSIKKLLQKSRRFVMTIAVTSCRVPVVKFIHRDTELEGDICLYNQLALHNTRLLQTYASLDERCRSLGLMAKHVFKRADICDASRGFLSSYAYILMVIYYLQHRSPAVLPCLQQMNTTDANRTPRVVDGWDTWFFEDTIEATRSAWPGYGLNKESIGSLWLGFLRFYTEEFDLANQVVAIRQLDPLLKLEKSIDTHVLAIEDPFNLSHNLGSGLRATAYAHIMKVFVKSRSHFGTPRESLPSSHASWENYMLDPAKFSVADGPTGFQCHFCKCVGHTYAKCERRLAALEEEKEEQQRLQRLRMEQMQMHQAFMNTGASPRVAPYARPMGPASVPRPAMVGHQRPVDASTGESTVPLPMSALLSPNKEQMDKINSSAKANGGDPAVAHALAQLYPDLVGSKGASQPRSQAAGSPTASNSALFTSLSSTLTPLLVDCHAHRQSLLSMNQVLTQLYAALTMLTNQLEQQTQQASQPGQAAGPMNQQLTVVVDQLRTGIGAFCGHVVQCCHHFDTQISAPVLQLANQIYQHQHSTSAPPTSTSNTTVTTANQLPVSQPLPTQAQAQANQRFLPTSEGSQMHQQLQQLITMQAVASNGAPNQLSLPQLQQWLQQQNQNMPFTGSTSTPRLAPALFTPTTAADQPTWAVHSQPSQLPAVPPSSTHYPALFGVPINLSQATGHQAPVASTASSTGPSETPISHAQNVFPAPFSSAAALFTNTEKPQ